jgi:hypothetical protein
MLDFRLTANINIGAGRTQFYARSAIAFANDHLVAVAVVYAARDAYAVVADILAYTFGIGGLGKHEPKRRRGHANQDFAHYFASGSLMGSIVAGRFGSGSMALAIRRGGKAKRNHCAEQHAGGRVELGLDWQRPRV